MEKNMTTNETIIDEIQKYKEIYSWNFSIFNGRLITDICIDVDYMFYYY